MMVLNSVPPPPYREIDGSFPLKPLFPLRATQAVKNASEYVVEALVGRMFHGELLRRWRQVKTNIRSNKGVKVNETDEEYYWEEDW